jgi:lipopolysaccharide/colanic/teichoic acid biosynthesis glycosyltransferase
MDSGNSEKKTVDGSKVEEVAEIIEEVRRLAESEAREIIDSAKRRASEIIETANEKLLDAAREEDLRIFPEDEFREILKKERTRADRSGHEFTLILYDLCTESSGRVERALVHALKYRSRLIDQFGWYEDGYLGVVLPNTGFEGAAKFSRDIVDILLRKKLPPPSFKIYVYPSKWNEKVFGCGKKWFGRGRGKGWYVNGVVPLFAEKLPRWKRPLDVFGAVVALALSSPFFIFVPLFIRMVSRGPVFFRQERVGYGGRTFTFLKFRTMHVNVDSDVHRKYYSQLMTSDKPMIKLDDRDPRIIPIGRILRKASIDEIPQLICVLKGDMSLVGPRPCLPSEARAYLKWQRYRYDVKPGMTGLWQVSGKDQLTFKQMIRLDILYAQRMSLFMDLKILLKTFPAVIAIFLKRMKIDAFVNQAKNNGIDKTRFKEFIKRFYTDIYNVDRLEYLEDKLGNGRIDLLQIILLLAQMNRLSPRYNVAKRYFGICKLIDYERKSQEMHSA